MNFLESIRRIRKTKELEEENERLKKELFDKDSIIESLKKNLRCKEAELEKIKSRYVEPKRFPKLIRLKNKALLTADMDLDGLVSTVLLDWAGWNFYPIFLRYGLAEILSRVEKAQMIIIADFSFYKDVQTEITQLLKKGIPVLYFDHHPITESLPKEIKENNRFKLVYKKDSWTAKVVYNFLNSKSKHENLAKEYVDMAGIADGKITGLPEEKDIATRTHLLQSAICSGRNLPFVWYVYKKLLDNTYFNDPLIWEMAVSYNPTIEKYIPKTLKKKLFLT